MKKLMSTAIITLTAFSMTTFAKSPSRIVETTIDTDHILVQPNAAIASYKVIVSGPEGTHEYNFSGDETAVLDVFSPEGELLPDGRYTYEIVAAPALSATDKADLAAARASGDAEWTAELTKAFAIERQSGSFSIHMGEILGGNAEIEEENPLRVSGKGNAITDADDPGRAQYFATDLIVDGSACVGTDCTSSESFGFDTLRLKENNLRIKFDDTSSSGSFPYNDWQLTANETNNGGENMFALEDVTNSKTPFKVQANAPNNALLIESGDGYVGMGTSNPVVQLHVADGDSPALRLEQDQSSGFTAQTWDIAGNETNFFVRDVTNSSQLPFKIKPGASHNQIVIDSDNQVGFGLVNPTSAMHLKRTDGSAMFHIEDTDQAGPDEAMLKLTNYLQAKMSMENTFSGNTFEIFAGTAGLRWNNTATTLSEFQLANDGSFRFGKNGNDYMSISATGLVTADNAEIDTLTVTTTLNQPSDVNLKEEFETVDPSAVLEKVIELPISTWEYKHDESNQRHMGVMAQDFYAAFGLGSGDRTISTIDPAGVTMAAIQGLNQKVETKNDEINQLRDRIAQLEALVQKMAEQQ